MSEEQGNIELKCSDCEHYKKVEITGHRMALQCTNSEAFKRNEGATKVGYINANLARFFAHNCGKDAVHFLEKAPESKETLSKESFTEELLSLSEKRAGIADLFTKGLVVLVVLIFLFILITAIF